jgi:L-fuconolactonase
MPIGSDQRVIDTHLHFWDATTYYRFHDNWLDARPELKRSFLPEDLQPHFQACGVHSGVIVEAGRDSHKLNLWLLELAQAYDYIGGVVAGLWVDNPKINVWLDKYITSPYFVGVRTHPSGNPESWGRNKDVQHLLRKMLEYKLSLDLLVTDDMFNGVAVLADYYPDLPIIVNHCGQPPFRDARLEQWQTHLWPLRKRSNIYIKYSPAFFNPFPELSNQFTDRMQPVVDFLLDTFGVKRLMWGSKWPVEMSERSYEALFHEMKDLASALSETEQALLFGGTASQVYRSI